MTEVSEHRLSDSHLTVQTRLKKLNAELQISKDKNDFKRCQELQEQIFKLEKDQ